ncbi:hypothetical protein BY996DRAFT_6409896 [Phakopsora pachyrhizi]|nr:hypothetical protein BY996DRAFT_6409896 [Phakopsora pachyrhizi]
MFQNVYIYDSENTHMNEIEKLCFGEHNFPHYYNSWIRVVAKIDLNLHQALMGARLTQDQSNHESHPHTIFIQQWWDKTLPRLPERTTAVGTTTGSGELSGSEYVRKQLMRGEKNSSLTPEMREKIELKKRQAQGIKAQRIRAALEAERIQNEKKVVAGERCLREFGITSGPTKEKLERFNGRTGSSDEIKVATEEKDFISLEDQ